MMFIDWKLNLVSVRWAVGCWISNEVTGSVNRRLLFEEFEWKGVNYDLFGFRWVFYEFLNRVEGGFDLVPLDRKESCGIVSFFPMSRRRSGSMHSR